MTNLTIKKCGAGVTLTWTWDHTGTPNQVTKCTLKSDRLDCTIDQEPEGKNIKNGTGAYYHTFKKDGNWGHEDMVGTWTSGDLWN